MFVEQCEVLRQTAAGARLYLRENILEVPLSHPREVHGESADRFKMFAQGIGVRDPGDDLIRDAGKMHVEHRVSQLRGDR